jgi:hypothetical protein
MVLAAKQRATSYILSENVIATQTRVSVPGVLPSPPSRTIATENTVRILLTTHLYGKEEVTICRAPGFDFDGCASLQSPISNTVAFEVDLV